MTPLPFIPCIFIGDSTANGAAMAYNASAARPCLVVARDGASPSAIAQSEIPGGAIGTAVIGAGTNDPLSPSLVSNLYATRRRISAQRVIWLLPYNRAAAYQVLRVAVAFGDFKLDLAELPGLPLPRRIERGLVHPKTYTGIATALRRWPIQ